MEFLESDTVRKVVDRLTYSADSVLIPGTSWHVVDYHEVHGGSYKVVVQVAPGKFVDVRADMTSKLRAVRNSVHQHLEAQREICTDKIVPQATSKKKSRGILRLVS